ncbi:MAG: glycosyltransferase family 2 protein [Bacteroidales bacterium]|nr:glycosyltransferase family 2 protein [Bacteroidales bacterium]
MDDARHEPDVSIIIVNYNSGEFLKHCLDSIFLQIHVNYQVIVYDNASSDDSLSLVQNYFTDSFPLTLIQGDENLGFSRANNLAVQNANGRLLHFLNPDVVVNDNLNRDYQDIIQSGTEGIWVTSLVDQEGKLLKNKHIVPRLRNYINRLFQKNNVAYWNIGASVMMNRSVFEKIHGWNESTFMYSEDLELFYQAYLQKIPITYLDTRIVHAGKGSTQHRWSELERAEVIEESFYKFFQRHQATWEYYLIRPVMLFYILFNEPDQFLMHFTIFCKRIVKRTG